MRGPCPLFPAGVVQPPAANSTAGVSACQSRFTIASSPRPCGRTAPTCALSERRRLNDTFSQHIVFQQDRRSPDIRRQCKKDRFNAEVTDIECYTDSVASVPRRNQNASSLIKDAAA